MSIYKIETNISKEDFVAYQKSIFIKKMKVMRMIILIVSIAILINTTVVYSLPLLMLAFILPSIFFVALPNLNKKQSIKTFELNSIQFKDLVYELNNELLLIKNEVGTSNLEWSYFNEITEVDDLIVLKHINGNGYLIPKRSFESEKHQLDVIEFIKSKLNKKSHLI